MGLLVSHPSMLLSVLRSSCTTVYMHECMPIHFVTEKAKLLGGKGEGEGETWASLASMIVWLFYSCRCHELCPTVAEGLAAAVVRQSFQEPVSPRLAKGQSPGDCLPCSCYHWLPPLFPTTDTTWCQMSPEPYQHYLVSHWRKRWKLQGGTIQEVCMWWWWMGCYIHVQMHDVWYS